MIFSLTRAVAPARIAAVLFFSIAVAACQSEEALAIPPPNAVRSSSGIASAILQVGFSNVHPSALSTVRVNYIGRTPDGSVFDSSERGGGPIEAPLAQLLPGWIEGIPLMVVGEKRRFWIPGNLAYDTITDRPNAPKGPVIFDIELLAVR